MGDYSRERYSGISPPRKGRSRSPAYRRDDRGISEERYEPANSLYVAGLSPRVTEQELLAHFEREGKVTECRLVTDPRTHDSRGFGFITMAEVEDAEACIKYLHRSTLEGRVIIVERLEGCRQNAGEHGLLLLANILEYADLRILPERDMEAEVVAQALEEVVMEEEVGVHMEVQGMLMNGMIIAELARHQSTMVTKGVAGTGLQCTINTVGLTGAPDPLALDRHIEGGPGAGTRQCVIEGLSLKLWTLPHE